MATSLPRLGLLAIISLTTAATRANAAQTPLFEYLGPGLALEDVPGQFMALGDVDGDGDLDVLKGRGLDCALLLNRGGGFFEPSSTPLPAVLTGALNPDLGIQDLELGDVDGDGDLDAVLATGASFSPSQNRLWLNDGNGAFADASIQLPQGAHSTSSIVLADLDEDGDLDLFGGGGWDEPDVLWLGDGTGAFGDASHLLPVLAPDAATFDVASADVDGDGDLDLLLGRASRITGGSTGDTCPTLLRGAQSVLLINDGSGVFANASVQLPQALWPTRAVALGDVDADGDIDAFLGNSGSAQSTHLRQDQLWLNDGTGVFVDATAQIPYDAEGSLSIALTDLDGDGDLDLIRGAATSFSCNPGTGTQNRLWRNDGAGSFRDAPLPASLALGGPVERSVLPGDLDDDGDMDLVVGSLDRAAVWLNDGSGGFLDATGPEAEASGPSGAAALGDLDGDGDVDALFGDRLLQNNGAGWFESTTATLPSTASPAQVVCLYDLDNDGDLDALVGHDGADALWFNDGAGGFVDVSTLAPANGDATTAIAVGDLNGDGRPDVVSAVDGAPNRLWLQDIDGAFLDSPLGLPATSESTQDLALADLDGDGDLDLWVANYWEPDVVLLNDGAATFTAALAAQPDSPHHTFAVRLADLDGDGDLDAIRCGGIFQPVHGGTNLVPVPAQRWLNDGSGGFTEQSDGVPMPPRHVRAFELVDVDGDGDLDALFDGTNGASEQVPFLWISDGVGGFDDSSARLAEGPPMPWGFAIGDLDEDGDVDVLSSRRIQRNVTRQLSSVNLPRVGGDFELLVHGQPGAVWMLASALAPARVPLGPLGTLRLDRSSLRRRGRGMLDSRGRAEFLYAVPPDPSLVGTSLYWQAYVEGPLGLTNLEVALLRYD